MSKLGNGASEARAITHTALSDRHNSNSQSSVPDVYVYVYVYIAYSRVFNPKLRKNWLHIFIVTRIHFEYFQDKSNQPMICFRVEIKLKMQTEY